MSDKTIRRLASAALALTAVAAAYLVTLLTDFEISRSFVGSMLSNFLASAALVGLSAMLLPWYLRRLRRPRLEVRPIFSRVTNEGGGARGTIKLGFRNLGDTTLERFYWHVFVPERLKPEITDYRNGNRIGTERINGYEYAHGYVSSPVFPNDGFELPIAIRIAPSDPALAECTLRCAFGTEFGQFPREAGEHAEWNASALADCEKVTVKFD